MENYFLAISIVVICCAVLAWVASCTKQPIILAYFLCGVILGPGVLNVLAGMDGFLEQVSRIGVTLLLFLAGLVLHPSRLHKFVKPAAIVTIGSCLVTWGLAFMFLRAWGHAAIDCNIGALALMFSSTILVVKLLPTTTLHQKRMGSICIAILIAEDLIAVALLLFMGPKTGNGAWHYMAVLPLTLILFIAVAVVCEQFVLRWMMRRSDQYGEVLVMLCLAWCLGLAVLAEHIGLSFEVGAFVAGVTMARGKIALVLSEELKPLRDFFLMFFFFVLGARFDLLSLKINWLPGLILAALIVLLRPIYIRWLFRLTGEADDFSKETGMRLGPASEFALIVVAAAVAGGRMSEGVSQLVQLTTMLTMMISTYIVVMKYPTPIGVKAKLKRD